MSIQTIVFFSFVLFIQYRSTTSSSSNLKNVHPKDEKLEESDVAAERQRAFDQTNKDLLRIKKLTKVFKQKGGSGNFTAVNGVSLSVPKGECFGLLGVNGAGKMVVCSHPGTGFHYSGFREYWNQVPVFDNFSESWEIVPLFGEIPNTGTKFQYDALAQ
mgnify:CR=1 FL=1